ncbi:MAG: 5'-methylthioadenosine/adenosylhomocysteine nucleosidase [Planctomycetota bacterium]
MRPILLALCLSFLLWRSAAPLRAGEETAPPVTGILGAMTLEVLLLTEALENPAPLTIEKLKFTTGKLNGRNVVVAKMGIGKVNAAIGATLLLEHFKPAEVLVTGISGGINPDLGPGDIVVAEKTAHHDFGDLLAEGLRPKGTRNPITGQRNPVFFPADPALLKLADVSIARLKLEPLQTAAGERTPRIIKGVVVSGDMFVADQQKRTALRKDFNADAVEMEGAAVMQACCQQGVPCLVIRSVSDLADANAIKDSTSFNKSAAANSAKLVRDILTQLAAAPGK